MEIIIELLLLLVLSLLFGEIAEKFRVPGIVGNIIAGMLLGPMLLNAMQPGPELSGIGMVSLFFIILLIGIEVTTEVLTKHVASALEFASASFIVPAIIMVSVAVLLFKLAIVQAIIVSVALGVPSISIISVLVLKYKMNRHEDGIRVLSGVVVADVLAFVVLAIASPGASATVTLLGILAFFVALFAADKLMKRHAHAIRKVFNSVSSVERSEDLVFAAVILLGFVVASILQLIGITYVLGAFFAGILIHEAIVGKRLYESMKKTFRRLNNSFFIPLFFSIAGLSVVLPGGSYIALLLCLIALSAVVGGVLDYAVAVRKLKLMRPRVATALFGSRGAVGAVIGVIALSEGLISNDLYSVIIMGTVLLSLVMPAMIGRSLWRAGSRENILLEVHESGRG